MELCRFRPVYLQQSHEIRSGLASWEQEQTSLHRRCEELRESIAQANQTLTEALDHKAAAEDQQNSVLQRLQDRREMVNEGEAYVQTTRDHREEHRSRIEELRVSQATQKQESVHLRNEYRSEFEAELPEEEDQLDREAKFSRCLCAAKSGVDGHGVHRSTRVDIAHQIIAIIIIILRLVLHLLYINRSS